jgi:hypothetical protein
MNTEKKALQNFIAQIAKKEFSSANAALQTVVAEKIKNKVRNYLSREK